MRTGEGSFLREIERDKAGRRGKSIKDEDRASFSSLHAISSTYHRPTILYPKCPMINSARESRLLAGGRCDVNRAVLKCVNHTQSRTYYPTGTSPCPSTGAIGLPGNPQPKGGCLAISEGIRRFSKEPVFGSPGQKHPSMGSIEQQWLVIPPHLVLRSQGIPVLGKILVGKKKGHCELDRTRIYAATPGRHPASSSFSSTHSSRS
jgi:hypothetical protein